MAGPTPGRGRPVGGTAGPAPRMVYMSVSTLSAPETSTETSAATSTDELTASDTPWVVIVWNDPVNLMSYVSYVFQSYFGYSKAKSNRLMLEVHHDGKSVVSTGSREKAERDTAAMHGYGLWATVRRAGDR